MKSICLEIEKFNKPPDIISFENGASDAAMEEATPAPSHPNAQMPFHYMFQTREADMRDVQASSKIFGQQKKSTLHYSTHDLAPLLLSTVVPSPKNTMQLIKSICLKIEKYNNAEIVLGKEQI